jgi:hypothetical protein
MCGHQYPVQTLDNQFTEVLKFLLSFESYASLVQANKQMKIAAFIEITFVRHLYGCSLPLQRGESCVWMDAREVLVVRPSGSDQVDPDFKMSLDRLKVWYAKNPADTIIVTGFIASTPQNIPTTLKRDGSDFSAAIMGNLFRAGRVTIWTDVSGVYSADPRKGAFLLVIFFAPKD